MTSECAIRVPDQRMKRNIQPGTQIKKMQMNGSHGVGAAALPAAALLLIMVMWAPAYGQESSQRRAQVNNRKMQVETVEDLHLVISGKSLLTISASKDAITNSRIELNSADAWVLLPALRPSVVHDDYLASFVINGEAAELDVNVRVAAVGSGTGIIPHGPNHTALETFTKANFGAEAMPHVVHKYYRARELGDSNDAIKSFRLQHGYMATLAENQDGTGASQVFIANSADIEIRSLPDSLRGKVSFVRVFPWRWTSKKGFGGSQKASEKLQTNWRYDWAAGGKSTLDIEYIPMRHNLHWDSFKKINSRENTTAVLGFNEPMQKDQAKMTVEQCIKLWPKLMGSGLRVGSIAPTDGSLDYLYRFMDEADKKGLRVDFVAVHCYHGNRSPEKWVSWLREIHRRTGRPIWVTEFNNGAPWVRNHNPSLKENAKHVQRLIRAMDNAPFVERYAIFNLGNPKGHRQIIKDDTLTPAGEMYRKHTAPIAYQPS